MSFYTTIRKIHLSQNVSSTIRKIHILKYTSSNTYPQMHVLKYTSLQCTPSNIHPSQKKAIGIENTIEKYASKIKLVILRVNYGHKGSQKQTARPWVKIGIFVEVLTLGLFRFVALQDHLMTS